MGVREDWRAMVASGALKPDAAQAFAVEAFEILAARLSRAAEEKPDFLSWFRPSPPAPKGLYLYGGVGAGKTMLMDLFFASCPFAPKRRAHFQAFMSETHDLIAQARRGYEGDPIPRAAEMIVREAELLCLDEFEVRDIADAMILDRLMRRLFESGMTLVATSNAAPRDLYPDGLNRALFLPCIELIELNCEVVALDAAQDYRRLRMGDAPLWFAPLGEEARGALDAAWRRLTGGGAASACELRVRGRAIAAPQAAMGVARFPFAELCDRPLGPDDYRAIARAFHTVIVDDVPIFAPERRNEARRFVTFIDALYDQGASLIASAEAEPDALYPRGDGADSFRRTASRLVEMRRGDWRENARGRARKGSTEGGLAVQEGLGQTGRD
jgi:cell division protein ZapE